jgi:hypothetical protein
VLLLRTSSESTLAIGAGAPAPPVDPTLVLLHASSHDFEATGTGARLPLVDHMRSDRTRPRMLARARKRVLARTSGTHLLVATSATDGLGRG